jgi:hypothetical protein
MIKRKSEFKPLLFNNNVRISKKVFINIKKIEGKMKK